MNPTRLIAFLACLVLLCVLGIVFFGLVVNHLADRLSKPDWVGFPDERDIEVVIEQHPELVNPPYPPRPRGHRGMHRAPGGWPL